MRRRNVFFLVGGIVGVFMLCGLCAGLVVIAGRLGARGGEGGAFGNAVQIVRVEGQIFSDDGPSSPFGAVEGAYSGRISRELKRARENPSVRAVVLRVDSPGGDVVASDEIHGAVARVRAAGKPVVVSMGSLAASGGYYVSAGADRILANPATITGSIGVITTIPNAQQLLEEKLGVQLQVMKTGAYKDEGSFARPLSDEERAIFQSVLADMFDQFVKVVADGRKLDEGQVRRLADGRIYTGKQARDLKLVDEFGDLEDAIGIAARLGNIVGEPRIIDRQRQSLWSVLFDQPTSLLARPQPSESALISQALRTLHLDRTVSFAYLYSP